MESVGGWTDGQTDALRFHDPPPMKYSWYSFLLEARGGAVGLGTAIQAGRSRVRFPMVSLEIFH